MSTEPRDERLRSVYETIREMSLQTDPQEMVRAYSRRMSEMFPVDKRISLSRRDLDFPEFRVTRYSEWKEQVNPWAEGHRLPHLKGGLFAELLYGDEPRIVDDIDELGLDASDPALPYLDGQGSLMAIPLLDEGKALNMVVVTREGRAAFDHETVPENFWLANLFGRATHNLVLHQKLERAYRQIDRELKVVADIQRSLLPSELPEIPGLSLAAYYRTSQRAGGDYYDIFPLENGKWGFLIADVSGHGTPSAVVMAITHCITHLFPDDKSHPDRVLEFVNRKLSERYTSSLGAFVTAFYGVYDPADRSLVYSAAGHNPPRVTRPSSSSVTVLDRAQSLPLGLTTDLDFRVASAQLQPGDRLILYTDGITEAQNDHGDLFGVPRLDTILQQCCNRSAEELLKSVLQMVDAFTQEAPPTDDRTMLIATVADPEGRHECA